MSPCMIFIDEIDAVGYARGNNNFIIGGGHREMETTLNQLLNEMDGFEENDKIIVVAATNLDRTLDPALSRPGRFDRKIEIKLPGLHDRVDIMKIHLKNVITDFLTTIIETQQYHLVRASFHFSAS
jgi:cell division protease FtsH